MRGIFIMIIASLFGLLTAATETIQYEESPNPAATLLVNTFNGKVEIESWQENFVKITAIKKARKEKYMSNAEIEIINSDKLEINAIALKKNPKVGISFNIQIPEGMEIELVDTSNGAIELKNIKGNGRFDTSNGKIEIHKSSGDFVLDTSNGSIKCEGIRGRISADTSNGSIKLFNVSEIKHADTSNGSITAEIHSINDDLNFSTSNGSITVYLNSELDAKIIANTSNSSVKLEGITMQVESQSRSYLRGAMGSGEYQINLSTSNGGIKIMGMAD